MGVGVIWAHKLGDTKLRGPIFQMSSCIFQSQHKLLVLNPHDDNQDTHNPAFRQRAILGAKALTDHVEHVDSGKEVRSFRSWKSSISLHSRASTRRKYVLDAASLPCTFAAPSAATKATDEEDESKASAGSMTSGSENEEEAVDGDELLLRLAAHDEIWRTQVMDFLKECKGDDSDSFMRGEERPQVVLGPFIF